MARAEVMPAHIVGDIDDMPSSTTGTSSASSDHQAVKSSSSEKAQRSETSNTRSKSRGRKQQKGIDNPEGKNGNVNANNGNNSSSKGKKRRRSKSQHRGNHPLFLVLCAVSQISLEDLYELLSSNPLFAKDNKHKPKIKVYPIPRHPPSSQEQAELYSKEYWPVVYRRGNPFGPHPVTQDNKAAVLMREYPGTIPAEWNVQGSMSVAEYYLTMARKVAEQGENAGCGLKSGCVVVEMQDDDINEAKIVAVACDARHNGHPLAHAVMRAVSFIGRKRNESSGRYPVDVAFSMNSTCLPIEEQFYKEHTVDKDGYLMHHLHIYLTHEPCVMCSMALLHSRVDLVIFGKDMKYTGGLHADLAPNSEPVHVVEDDEDEYFDALEYLPYDTSSGWAVASTKSPSVYHDARESVSNMSTPSKTRVKTTSPVHQRFFEGDTKSQFSFHSSETHQTVADFDPDADDFVARIDKDTTGPDHVSDTNTDDLEAELAGLMGTADDEEDQLEHPSNQQIIDFQKGRIPIPSHYPGRRDGYGLHWREKVNWKFLCWQWRDADNMDPKLAWIDNIPENENL